MAFSVKFWALSGSCNHIHQQLYSVAMTVERMFEFEFTASVVRSSTDAPFIPLQLS